MYKWHFNSLSLDTVHYCSTELVKLKNDYEQGVLMNHPWINSPAMNSPSALLSKCSMFFVNFYDTSPKDLKRFEVMNFHFVSDRAVVEK